LALAVAAMFGLAVQSYRAIERELTDAALSKSAALAELATVTLSEKLDRLTDIGVSLADRVRFRELIAAGEWAQAIRILDRVRDEFPVVDRLFLTDPAGTLRADIPLVPEVHGKSFADRDWYRGLAREWKPYVSNVYRRAAAPRKNVFAVAVPIRGRDGAVLGALVLQVRLDSLFEWTRRVDVGRDGYLYIVDRAGRVAFHPRQPYQDRFVELADVPAVSRALEGGKGVEIAAEPDGGESVRAYEPVRKYGWAVVAEQPASAAFATRDQQLRHLALAYGLTGGFCAIAVYLGSSIATERRRAEEDRHVRAGLERAVADRTGQLQASVRELEEFTYTVSHDLRAPLRAIGGFSRIVQEDHGGQLDGEGRRLVRVIQDNSRRMAELIDDLLEYARLGRKPLARSRVDAAGLVGEILRELEAGGGRGGNVVVAALPEMHGDPTLLKQVWTNLLANALKFSAAREQPVVEVSGYEEGPEAVYCVKDNGAGFDMKYYGKLFGVFQRLHAHEEFPGTGVGLAIVQRAVTRHGGRVWAEGRVGEGAAFYFSLPREGAG